MREQLLASLKPLNACDEDSRGGGDHDLNPDRVPDQNTKAAAVLVPIVARDTGPTVLLTVRTQHLRAHAGQVSFPGGRTDEEDDSPIATALREAQEEVGLKSFRRGTARAARQLPNGHQLFGYPRGRLGRPPY